MSKMINRKLPTVKNIPYYGTGGIDMSGEWQWSGSYYTYVGRTNWLLNHNYEIDYRRKFSRNKWAVYIYVCLTASNSSDFLIFNGIYSSLKEAKSSAIAELLKYDSSFRFDNEVLPVLIERQKPVFVKIKDEIKLIGSTYKSMSSDIMENNVSDWRYYHRDFPDYNNWYSTDFYELDHEGKIWETQRRSSCYISGGVTPSETIILLKQILPLIECDARFTKIYNTCKEKMTISELNPERSVATGDK